LSTSEPGDDGAPPARGGDGAARYGERAKSIVKAVAGTGIVLSAAGFYLQTRALKSDIAALEVQAEQLEIEKRRIELEEQEAEREREAEKRRQEAEAFQRAERLFQLANTVCTLTDPDEINSRLKLLTGITGATGIDARFCLSYRGGESFRGTFALPVDISAEISGRFGTRVHPILGTTRFHAGTDWKPGTNDSVLAAADGIVAYAQDSDGYGERIIIDHGNNWRTTYSHLSRIECSAGDIVLAGQVIGRMGSTGLSTGTHLHFEVLAEGEFVDPATRMPDCEGPACQEPADGG
jgi:murein DD-endopeptidase MepM/ murein hydrolase activator NlpD